MAERRRPKLTLEQLESIQLECMADDVPIDFDAMAPCTEDEARAFFESGGEERPDMRAAGDYSALSSHQDHARPDACMPPPPPLHTHT